MSPAPATALFQSLKYYLAEQPTVVGFRWSHSESWGSTWSFLFTAIAVNIISATALHAVLLIIFRHRASLPLGPLPAIQSLSMTAISATIVLCTVLFAAAEIRDTRCLWRRSRTTAFQWFLCFPLGTLPSGRVFFSSYTYYLSRFLDAIRPLITVVQRRRLPVLRILHHAISIIKAFLWLEFSQSFQLLGILCATMAYAVVYGYRFWTAVGLPWASLAFVVNCHMVLLGSDLVCHVGVVLLHFIKGGCNGIGTWVFKSFLNAGILYQFLNFYVGIYLRKRKAGGFGDGCFMDRDKDS